MKYRKVYFDEENQKVRWTMNNTADLAVTYEYLGTMSRVEIDSLVKFFGNCMVIITSLFWILPKRLVNSAHFVIN